MASFFDSLKPPPPPSRKSGSGTAADAINELKQMNFIYPYPPPPAPPPPPMPASARTATDITFCQAVRPSDNKTQILEVPRSMQAVVEPTKEDLAWARALCCVYTRVVAESDMELSFGTFTDVTVASRLTLFSGKNVRFPEEVDELEFDAKRQTPPPRGMYRSQGGSEFSELAAVVYGQLCGDTNKVCGSRRPRVPICFKQSEGDKEVCSTQATCVADEAVVETSRRLGYPIAIGGSGDDQSSAPGRLAVEPVSAAAVGLVSRSAGVGAVTGASTALATLLLVFMLRRRRQKERVPARVASI